MFLAALRHWLWLWFLALLLLVVWLTLWQTASFLAGGCRLFDDSTALVYDLLAALSDGLERTIVLLVAVPVERVVNPALRTTEQLFVALGDSLAFATRLFSAPRISTTRRPPFVSIRFSFRDNYRVASERASWVGAPARLLRGLQLTPPRTVPWLDRLRSSASGLATLAYRPCYRWEQQDLAAVLGLYLPVLTDAWSDRAVFVAAAVLLAGLLALAWWLRGLLWQALAGPWAAAHPGPRSWLGVRPGPGGMALALQHQPDGRVYLPPLYVWFGYLLAVAAGVLLAAATFAVPSLFRYPALDPRTGGPLAKVRLWPGITVVPKELPCYLVCAGRPMQWLLLLALALLLAWLAVRVAFVLVPALRHFWRLSAARTPGPKRPRRLDA